jgi:hypothetical protein
MRRRGLVLTLGLLGYLAILAWCLTFAFGMLITDSGDRGEFVRLMFSPTEWEMSGGVWLGIGVPAAVIAITQWVFILPVVSTRPPTRGRAHSLRGSMIVAGLMAGVLTFALGCGLIGLIQLVGASAAVADPADVEPPGAWLAIVALFMVLAISWALWSLALLSFARRRMGRGVLSRTIGLLLGGTIVEVIVVLPIDVMIRRRTDCYCGTGTFFAMVLSAWALLWLAGPGIVIAACSKRRDAWWDLHCESCGYAKGPSPGARCPECGHEWAQAETTQP